METLFTFQCVKRRQIVPVRRDPKFAPQLYFLTTENKGPDLWVLLEQAIWDRKRKQITSCVFYKQLVDVPSSKMHCAVDERDKVLHILADGGSEATMFRVDLKFEKPDKLGYRRAWVPNRAFSRGSRYGLATFHDGKQLLLDKVQYDVSLMAIDICPTSAEPVLHFKYVDEKQLVCFFSRRLYVTPPDMRWMTTLRSQEMELRSHVFSRSGHLLTLVSYHSRNPPADGADQAARNRIRMVFDDGFITVYSRDTQMQHVNALPIFPVQLVANFLPKALVDGLKAAAPARMPDFMFFGAHLQLLGEVHKYVLFFFHHHYVLAAKWPKNWYKLNQVPKMKQKRVICVDKQQKHGEIRDVWIGSTDLYFKVELQGVEGVRRMSLGHKMKDYRRCAFCGKEEKGKRKNKQGKRVSNFKVCRLCKEQNRHKSHTDTAPGCHYCSFECVRKDWKEHKLVHGVAGK